MNEQWYIRVESKLGYYAFYSVENVNKTDAGILARKQFANDFGGTFDNCKVGYTWDMNSSIINKWYGMKISEDIRTHPLYD